MVADNTKYVVIKENGLLKMIVFSTLLKHSVFKYLEPVSAGFVSFGTDSEDRCVTGECYGASDSLDGLKSNQEVDDQLLKDQILRAF